MFRLLKLSPVTEPPVQRTPVQLQGGDVAVQESAHSGLPKSCLRVRRASLSEERDCEITETGRRGVRMKKRNGDKFDISEVSAVGERI